MAGIAFEETVIFLRSTQTRERIAEHSPSRKVPVLIIKANSQNRTLWDTLAICETLAERHKDIAFWPEDRGRREEARCIVAEMHSGFPRLREQMPMDLTTRHPTPEINSDLNVEIERIKSIWTSALERFRGDGEFLFGEFSLADAFFAPVVTRVETYSIALPAIAQAYTQRILALEPMRKWRDAAEKEMAEASKASGRAG